MNAIPVEPRERRKNDQHAGHIMQAIEIQKASGDAEAYTFMWERGVPKHTILRILAGAAFRRKYLQGSSNFERAMAESAAPRFHKF
jgi:hypothetical protein